MGSHPTSWENSNLFLKKMARLKSGGLEAPTLAFDSWMPESLPELFPSMATDIGPLLVVPSWAQFAVPPLEGHASESGASHLPFAASPPLLSWLNFRLRLPAF